MFSDMKTILQTVSVIALLATSFASGCASSAAAQGPTNRDVMNRYFELVDSKQVDDLPSVEGPGLSYKLPLGTMDAATHSKVIQSFAIAFPNFKHTLSRCVEAGDLIACEGNFTGDHTGPLAMPDGSSLPATQKHVDFPIVSFGRVEDGKFVEYDGYFDVLGFLAQLGVGPGAPKSM